MNVRVVTFLALALAAVSAHSANLYRWVDAQGNVHYTDSPPPQEAKAAEEKKFAKVAPTVALPYALQQAVKLAPVTLYASAKECGEPCDAARKLLEKRGVPFTEKDAREAAVQDELKKLTGGPTEIPVLKVGKTFSKGFLESTWHQSLDAANYPKSSQLPRTVKARTVAPSTEENAPAAQSKDNKTVASAPADAIKPTPPKK